MNARTIILAAMLAVSAGLAQPTIAQDGSTVVRRDPIPQRETLRRMTKPITVNTENIRLQDAINFLQQVTGADLEPIWDDGSGDGGLDPEQEVSIRVEGVSALAVLEKLLAQSRDQFGFGSGATWQMTEWGAMQIGPKDILNHNRSLKIYPISDLILVIPNYEDAPTLDLNAVLQSGQGGGGRSPFRNITTDDREYISAEERAEPIIDMVVSLVEPEQWEQNGGSGASVRFWQGNLLVNAPDYIHRGIDGYPYWPAEYTIARTVGGRRYITMGIDTSIGTVEGFDQQPVTGIVPGGGTGGGGNPPPP